MPHTADHSARTLSALARFGVLLDDPCVRAGPIDFSVHAASIASSLRPGARLLITGPSGSGKSTLASDIAAHARARRWHVLITRDLLADLITRNPPIIDAFPPDFPIDASLRLLARFGLGDATLLARRVTHLSDGQRARLSLALATAISSTSPRSCILADEFTSGLDRPGARVLCASIARPDEALHAPAIMLATAHDDVRAWLPGFIDIRLSADHTVDISESTCPARAAPISISRGTRSDYLRLAHLHYRAGPPATIAPGRSILVARGFGEPRPLGVLVVSMPTLNGRWRDLAWPGRFNRTDKSGASRLLNDELRTISRVIVDPRFRAAGVARRLVRAYLDRPLTRSTEAIAAMGAASPFFARAGMREILLASPARHSRLRDALDALGITVESLLDAGARSRALASHALLRREVLHWAMASRAGRASRGDPHAALALAARSLGAACVAYVHDVPG